MPIANPLSNLIKKSRDFLKSFTKEQYDFWDAVTSNSMYKSQSPAKDALKWLDEQLKTRKAEISYGNKVLSPARLYRFDYDHPKFESTLDYFDTQPLAIIMTLKVSPTQGAREVGINLHLLPPRIRILVLNQIFLMHKDKLRKGAAKKPNQEDASFGLSWKELRFMLKHYGAGFAVRMYIPKRRTNTIEFKLRDWDSAIFLPTKRYAKITQSKLESEWRKYLADSKNTIVTSSSLIQESYNTKF